MEGYEVGLTVAGICFILYIWYSVIKKDASLEKEVGRKGK